MKALLLRKPGPVEGNPLILGELPTPQPKPDEVLVRVSVCGICRTDLNVVEGDLPSRLSPIVPGHQVVGVVERRGADVRRYSIGERVGIAWLHRTCGICDYCLAQQENLCDKALFTGYSAQGGFAEFITAPEAFVYAIPQGFDDLQAAPLLCAGIIGFRCLRIAGAGQGTHLGFYGFGAAAHVAIQVARHWGVRVSVMSRDERHQALAREMGATWVGGSFDRPPQLLDAAIIFAPAGELVPAALAVVRKGGMVVLGGIHMSPIPQMPYELLYGERVLRSVMNNTRTDGRDFLATAATIPIRTQVEAFAFEEANLALARLKNDALRGAAVLRL